MRRQPQAGSGAEADFDDPRHSAREIVDTARDAGILLGVVSQHRFDRASLFLSSAIRAGRLGRLLQCDAYVKWWRSDEY